MGVGGADRFFSAECRGGEGGRVEDECRALVNRRETDAVAVEVPRMGATVGGASRLGRTGDRCCIDGGRGCFSRIVRRDSSVRSTCIVSEDDESDDAESSSMDGMGIKGLVRWSGELLVLSRAGVTERPRKEGEVRMGGGGDLDRRLLRLDTTVDIVDVLDLRVDGFRTMYDDKTSTARFGCSGAGGQNGDGTCTGKLRSEGRGVGGNVLDDRSPRVGGRMIALGSAVESTYMVRARGAGEMRSRRWWLDNCSWESVVLRSRVRKSRDGLLIWEACTRAERL